MCRPFPSRERLTRSRRKWPIRPGISVTRCHPLLWLAGDANPASANAPRGIWSVNGSRQLIGRKSIFSPNTAPDDMLLGDCHVGGLFSIIYGCTIAVQWPISFRGAYRFRTPWGKGRGDGSRLDVNLPKWTHKVRLLVWLLFVCGSWNLMGFV